MDRFPIMGSVLQRKLARAALVLLGACICATLPASAEVSTVVYKTATGYIDGILPGEAANPTIDSTQAILHVTHEKKCCQRYPHVGTIALRFLSLNGSSVLSGGSSFCQIARPATVWVGRGNSFKKIRIAMPATGSSADDA